jgi:hypothetical protein
MAVGGSVHAGRMYRVNENGPEFFKPNMNGTVIPMGGGRSGGDTVVYNIDARGAQRGVSDEIKKALKQTEDSAVRRSVSQVGEERRRSSNYAKVFKR